MNNEVLINLLFEISGMSNVHLLSLRLDLESICVVGNLLTNEKLDDTNYDIWYQKI